jgi:hypothetical protein
MVVWEESLESTTKILTVSYYYFSRVGRWGNQTRTATLELGKASELQASLY